MHLILPHSLRCPADAYFTQVVGHYPHLHRELDTGELRYGHFEDPLPSVASLRLPVDMQGRTHHISGYRLLNWSPAITQNAHIDRASLDTVLTIAGVLSYFTVRSIRLTDENSKLLILAPHNDHYSRFTGRIRHSFAALSSHSIRLLSCLYLSDDAPPDSYFSLCP